MKKSFLALVIALFAASASTSAQTTAGMPAAETVLKDAYSKAAKENKKVLLIFHASWCGWCKKMEASLNDPTIKKNFDDNYVIATLDVQEQPAKKSLENPGGMDVMTKLKGEKAGLPFWVVMDATGKVLADSQVRPAGASLDSYGENVGCPSSDSEVTYFTQILKATSKISDDQIALISKRFAQNQPAPQPAKPVAPAGTE